MVWIEGFEGRYAIDENGVVYTFCGKCKNGTLLPERGANGYMRVTLVDENHGRHRYLLHRLVASAFIPNPDNKRCINHINGDKSDNRVDNLEWCTHRENNVHALRTGLRTGEKSGKPCVIMGVYYDSRKEAATALGISGSAVSWRINHRSECNDYPERE